PTPLWADEPAAAAVAAAAPPVSAQEAPEPEAPEVSGAPDAPPAAEIDYRQHEVLGKGVTRAQLSNGLTVIVRENHAAPVATVRCFVRNTGSAYEDSYLGMGLSHILEHLVAGGSTTKKSEQQIQTLVDSMGGQTNAFTTTDVTAFFIDCPAKRVNQAIELIAENMQFSLIPNEEFQREMGVVQRELEMGEADRLNVLHHAMKSLLYTEHPIRHPTIGYLPVVQQVNRLDVFAFYKTRYVPQNLVFVIVGDVQTESVLKEVKERFQETPRATERFAVLAAEPDQVSPRSTSLQMDGDTTHFSLAWPTIPLQHPDLYALDVASYLLGHGDSSRIATRLKVEKPLAILVDSSSYTPAIARGWFDVTIETTAENLVECRKVIDEEIDRLQRDLVKPQELTKVKRQKSAEHVFAQQTVEQQADALANSFIATGDPLFDDHYVAGIQQVTAEQVREVARKYLRPNTRNTVVIDPLGSKRATVEVMEAERESPVVRKQLANGLTLLLKKQSATPTVAIQAYAKGGVLADTDATSGLSALTCEMLTRGTRKYSEEQIGFYFDSIGGVLSVSSQANTCSLACQILKDDLPTTLDYVHQMLFRPQMNAEEFKQAVEHQLAQLAARRAQPQADIFDFWSTNLPTSTPYHRPMMGLDATLKKLKLADCQQFHARFFVPNNMVLAIYGDIDPAKLLPELEQLFGGERRGADNLWTTIPERHTKQSGGQANAERPRENTALLLMSYPAFTLQDTKSKAALDVLDSLLTGGGGIGGRLFQELRGEQLVYYCLGLNVGGVAPGYYVFLAQTRPETVNEVRDRIQRAVDKVAREGIPADEFALTKEKLLAAHA
ncbi:MAG: M16 family metallopeptidase, partial [Planctomycetota bacterium]